MTDNIRYEIILHWSNADQAFIAEVPELAGCAADGATYSEALQNIDSGQFITEGRVYGGGLHKVEPKELARISAGSILDAVQGYVRFEKQLRLIV